MNPKLSALQNTQFSYRKWIVPALIITSVMSTVWVSNVQAQTSNIQLDNVDENEIIDKCSGNNC